jgi:hypothetical protein
LTEEDSRAVWRWAPIEDFFMDVRFGARMLQKNAGFTAIAVFTLALGIAANTTIWLSQGAVGAPSSGSGCALDRVRQSRDLNLVRAAGNAPER